jgi:hypothetical protein
VGRSFALESGFYTHFGWKGIAIQIALQDRSYSALTASGDRGWVFDLAKSTCLTTSSNYRFVRYAWLCVLTRLVVSVEFDQRFASPPDVTYQLNMQCIGRLMSHYLCV